EQRGGEERRQAQVEAALAQHAPGEAQELPAVPRTGREEDDLVSELLRDQRGCDTRGRHRNGDPRGRVETSEIQQQAGELHEIAESRHFVQDEYRPNGWSAAERRRAAGARTARRDPPDEAEDVRDAPPGAHVASFPVSTSRYVSTCRRRAISPRIARSDARLFSSG